MGQNIRICHKGWSILKVHDIAERTTEFLCSIFGKDECGICHFYKCIFLRCRVVMYLHIICIYVPLNGAAPVTSDNKRHSPKYSNIESFNQSINQSINEGINESINESINIYSFNHLFVCMFVCWFFILSVIYCRNIHAWNTNQTSPVIRQC